MKKLIVALAALALGTAGCTNSESSTEPTAEEPSTSSASSTSVRENAVLGEGDSFEVPCSTLDSTSCMTVDIVSINAQATCATYEGAEPGRFVALEFTASMPEDADTDFTSPFRTMPWSVSTNDGEISRSDTEIHCDGADSYLNLMDEFPGYSATGTAYLPVPDNADLVHFEVADGDKVKIAIPADEGGAQSNEAGQPAESIDEPAPAASQPPAPTQAPAPTQVPAPAPAPVPQQEPVIGFTEAPGQVAPHPLDKQIASCGDPSIHETGTTFFTDGTSGWTQQCSNQMM